MSVNNLVVVNVAMYFCRHEPLNGLFLEVNVARPICICIVSRFNFAILS